MRQARLVKTLRDPARRPATGMSGMSGMSGMPGMPGMAVLAFAVAGLFAVSLGSGRTCDADGGAAGPIGGGQPGAAATATPTATTSTDSGKNLDEWLAYVAGETITRRMIVRQIGERVEGQTEADQERSIYSALLRRVHVGCMVWKARQFGLDLRPDVLDEQVATAAKAEVEQAKDRGLDLTFEQILARRGQSLDEFKELLARQILVENYWMILIRGIPGKKPQLDPEPSPKDCKTLYDAHRDAFDVQPGVRLAMFQARPTDALERAGDYDAAVKMTQAELRGLAAESAAAGEAEKVAAAHKLQKNRDWSGTAPGKFTEKGLVEIASGATPEAW